jgi:hypothetical protein
MDFDVGVVIQMDADCIGGDSIHPRLRGDVSQVQDGWWYTESKAWEPERRRCGLRPTCSTSLVSNYSDKTELILAVIPDNSTENKYIALRSTFYVRNVQSSPPLRST